MTGFTLFFAPTLLLYHGSKPQSRNTYQAHLSLIRAGIFGLIALATWGAFVSSFDNSLVEGDGADFAKSESRGPGFGLDIVAFMFALIAAFLHFAARYAFSPRGEDHAGNAGFLFADMAEPAAAAGGAAVYIPGYAPVPLKTLAGGQQQHAGKTRK